MIIYTDGFIIEKYEKAITGNPFSSSKANYIICETDPLDTAYKNKLISLGFRFLDRRLHFEIQSSRPAVACSSDALADIEFVCDGEFDNRLFELACRAYVADRRFHLEPLFDQSMANQVIKAYISEFEKKKMKVYKAYHGKELLGFTVADEMAGENGDSFENVLGATTPGIKGKMVAVPLYRYMIMCESTAGKRKYIGKVSSTNCASMNLHIQLGGSVKKVYDDFIFKRR